MNVRGFFCFHRWISKSVKNDIFSRQNFSITTGNKPGHGPCELIATTNMGPSVQLFYAYWTKNKQTSQIKFRLNKLMIFQKTGASNSSNYNAKHLVLKTDDR